LAVVYVMAVGSVSMADTFGTGANQFTIDFVPISGDASSANGTNISQYSPGQSGYNAFSDPGDYRMGKYEITNAQWNKFEVAYGSVFGNPTGAYDERSYFLGSSVPVNYISWYEAAQFVNWLNTSKGYQAAYKFTGTIHTSSYTLGMWGTGDADGTNRYRNKAAKYFLPTENEWVKAAYWNGSNLQTWATIGDVRPSHPGWNYDVYSMQQGPWNVGSGHQELNGTFDMMGNVWEWNETLFDSSYRGLRGGSFFHYILVDSHLASSFRRNGYQSIEGSDFGFRVASVIPEPCMLLLLGLGGVILRKKYSV
jgi:formylglycine-generating enzyme required for sulfatase activity